MSPPASAAASGRGSPASRFSNGIRRSSSRSNAASITRCSAIEGGAAWLRSPTSACTSPPSICYPAVYQEDLRASVRDFYDKFYGVKLTDKQLEALVRSAGAPTGETGQMLGVPLLGAEPVPLPGEGPPTTPGLRPPGRGGTPGLPGYPPLAAPPNPQ